MYRLWNVVNETICRPLLLNQHTIQVKTICPRRQETTHNIVTVIVKRKLNSKGLKNTTSLHAESF